MVTPDCIMGVLLLEAAIPSVDLHRSIVPGVLAYAERLKISYAEENMKTPECSRQTQGATRRWLHRVVRCSGSNDNYSWFESLPDGSCVIENDNPPFQPRLDWSIGFHVTVKNRVLLNLIQWLRGNSYVTNCVSFSLKHVGIWFAHMVSRDGFDCGLMPNDPRSATACERQPDCKSDSQ